VEGLDGGLISEICRCTGSQSWHAGDWPNNWVWVNQCPGRCYGALNGRLPWQLQWLFKINLLIRIELSLSTSQPWHSPQYVKTLVTWIQSRNVYKWETHRQPLLCQSSAWETLLAAHT
jgi:hypothetical protein